MAASSIPVVAKDWSPLFVALLSEDKQAIEHCKDDILYKSVASSSTALHIAVISGNIYSVEWVLKQAAYLADMPNRFGETPLHWAASSGNIEIVQTLLDPNCVMNYDGDGNTALHWAVEHDYEPIASLLLKNGYSATKQNSLGKSAIDLAISCDSKNCKAMFRAKHKVSYFSCCTKAKFVSST